MSERRRMLRGAAGLALPAGAACVLGGLALGGVAGALGAALGTAVVLAFFGAAALVMSGSSRLPPAFTMVVVLGGYVLQVIFLLVVVTVLQDVDWFARTPFVVAVLVVSAAWLTGFAWGHVRTVRASRMTL